MGEQDPDTCISAESGTGQSSIDFSSWRPSHGHQGGARRILSGDPKASAVKAPDFGYRLQHLRRNGPGAWNTISRD